MHGCEWIVEAYGCSPGALCDQGRLERLFVRIVADLKLQTVAEARWHQFPGPGGVTGLLMLAESHLACHTFPEHQSLCLNLFCCRPRPDWDFEGYLKREFAARDVRVRRLDRPYTLSEIETPDERENRQLPELRRTDHVSLV